MKFKKAQPKISVKKQIIRISILQSSKMMTALYVLMMPPLSSGRPRSESWDSSIFFMPVFMGIFGFVFFVIFAAIYNFLAAKLGGIEVETRNLE